MSGRGEHNGQIERSAAFERRIYRRQAIGHLTKRLTKELVDAYMNNPTFQAVVKHHEIEGSIYTAMLEDAVVKLVAELDAQTKLLLRHLNEIG